MRQLVTKPNRQVATAKLLPLSWVTRELNEAIRTSGHSVLDRSRHEAIGPEMSIRFFIKIGRLLS
jgi:hypothetical protein